jgi:transcriptional regulator with XRE-family HTH domain
VAAPHSPIGSRRRLGAELRRLRNRTGLTLDEVAEQMTCSTSKISRLETGKGIPKVPDVRELMRIYGVASTTEQDMLLRLVRDGREHGWWEPLTDSVAPERYMMESLSRYVAMENDATAVRSFDMTIVHGLLQTEAYVRSIITSTLPHHSAEEIDRLIELRTMRQEALYRTDPPPLSMTAVIDEAVLRRAVGGPAVMTGQLQHLLDVTEQPNVDVRVLPFATGILRAHAGHFVLLEIPEALGSDVVHIETHAGERFLEEESDVDIYREVHANAVESALSIMDSKAIISRYKVRHGR